MAYSATFWVNNSEPAITAEKLNKIEYGVASGHAIAESKASTDYVQGQVAAEVDARINYVDAAVNNYDIQVDKKLTEVGNILDGVLKDPSSVISSDIVNIVETQASDPNSNTSASITSTAVSAVDTEWALNTLTTNINTAFGDNASTIEQNITSFVDAEWSLNDLTTTIESKFGENFTTFDETVETSVNDKFSLSTMKTNLESVFGTNVSNINTKLSTYAQAEDVGAIAQVALDVNGRITGWTAVDSSVGGSAFRINADTFSLADASNEHVPFAIDATTGLTQFNGIVNFTNTDMNAYDNSNVDVVTSSEVVADINNGNTTTINGGRITTNSLSANSIYTTDAFVGHTLQSTDYDGTNGFRLKSNAAGTSSDPTIYGAYIKGAEFEANQILAKNGDRSGDFIGINQTFHSSPFPTNGASTTLASDRIYANSYGTSTSYYKFRLVKSSSFVLLKASGRGLALNGANAYIYLETYDSSTGTWVTRQSTQLTGQGGTIYTQVNLEYAFNYSNFNTDTSYVDVRLRAYGAGWYGTNAVMTGVTLTTQIFNI